MLPGFARVMGRVTRRTVGQLRSTRLLCPVQSLEGRRCFATGGNLANGEEKEAEKFAEDAEGDMEAMVGKQALPPVNYERVEQFPHVYSASSHLAQQTEADVGKWYEVSKEDMEKIPQVIKKSLADPLEMGGSYLMLRQGDSDLLRALNEINSDDAEESAAGATVGVYGPRGSGKTVTMNVLSMYAVQNDWLLLSTTADEFPTDHHGFIVPSTTKEGIFEQRRYSSAYLKNLMKTQGYNLKKIQLKRSYDYEWRDPEKVDTTVTEVDVAAYPAPTNLYDLCKQGTIQEEIAALVFYDLVEEVKLATEVKTMVVIDNINLWDQPSKFRRPENGFKHIYPRELSMVDAFGSFLKSGPSNGLTAFAMCSHATQNFGRKHLSEATYTIKQTIYSDAELKSAITHYKVSRLIFAEVDAFLLARIKGLTGNVGRDVFFDAALI